mgnify:CR=1 FL=1
MNLNVRGKENRLGYSFYTNKTNTTPYTQNEDANVYAKTATGKVKPSSYPAGMNSSLKSKLKDYYNDEDMLEMAGVSYVVDNAPDDLKEKADHVTLSNNDDGVAFC